MVGAGSGGIANALSLPLVLLIGLGGAAEPQAASPTGAQAPESYRISVDINLVVLNNNCAGRERPSRFRLARAGF